LSCKRTLRTLSFYLLLAWFLIMYTFVWFVHLYCVYIPLLGIFK